MLFFGSDTRLLIVVFLYAYHLYALTHVLSAAGHHTLKYSIPSHNVNQNAVPDNMSNAGTTYITVPCLTYKLDQGPRKSGREVMAWRARAPHLSNILREGLSRHVVFQGCPTDEQHALTRMAQTTV